MVGGVVIRGVGGGGVVFVHGDGAGVGALVWR